MDDHDSTGRWGRWVSLFIAGLLIYALSSGPMLATTFWLREKTDWDGFYAVMWVYFPLLIMGHSSPFVVYIEWWVKLFGTVGPG